MEQQRRDLRVAFTGDGHPVALFCTLRAWRRARQHRGIQMPKWELKDKAAVAGAGNSAYGRRLMRSPIDLAAEAIRNALDDAGLKREELDGLIVSFGSPIGVDGDSLAQVLGLKLRAYNQT